MLHIHNFWAEYPYAPPYSTLNFISSHITNHNNGLRSSGPTYIRYDALPVFVSKIA